jgi:hypothetical protein
MSCLNFFSNRTISPSPSSLCQPACTVEEVVNLLRHLYSLSPNKQADDSGNSLLDHAKGYHIPLDEFVSKKITNKLGQQLQDPLVLASRALPSWCEDLTYSAPMLFPFDTRNLYFSCTAYGTSRYLNVINYENTRILIFYHFQIHRLASKSEGHEYRTEPQSPRRST